MNDTLYVIVPYFNFLNKQGFDKNLHLSLKNFKKYSNVQVIVSEASYSGEFLEVDCFKHLKYKTSQILWLKENLINLAIKSLPEDWNYVAWVDRDIEFLNQNWVNETIESLNNFDVIQPWSHVLYLNENKDIQCFTQIPKENISANCFFLKKRNLNLHTCNPGHAWAANRNFFNKINFLYDKMIFGAGDVILVDCLLKFLDENANESEIFYTVPKEYKDKYKDIKVSFINGSIYHHFHGDLLKRKAIEIENQKIKRDEIYNLLNMTDDIFFYREDGLLQLKEDNAYIEDIFKKYLLQREEV
jgi:hypothetical protein